MKSVLDLGSGKMSTFGGPLDLGVGPGEGLALLNPTDFGVWWYESLLLPQQPTGTTGLARRLNPRAFYLAMRWDEVLAPHGLSYFTPQKTRNLVTTMLLRHCYVRLSNPRNGSCIFARPVDYGPGDGRVIDGKQDEDTDRLADLSPAAADALSLKTDQIVRCELILPQVES